MQKPVPSLNKDTVTIDDLQKEKIQLEIGDLKKPWYKRKDYLQILLPTTLAIFSLIYALVSGFFSNKYEQLQLQEKQIKFDISVFEQKKDKLINTNEKLIQENKSLEGGLQEQKVESKELKNKLIKKRNEVNKLLSQLEGLNYQRTEFTQQIQQLQTDYTDKKKAFSGEMEKQYLSEVDLNRKLKEKDKQIKSLANRLNLAEHELSLSHINPYIQKGKKSEYELWILEQMDKYLTNIADSLSKNSETAIEKYERSKRSLDTLESKHKAAKFSN